MSFDGIGAEELRQLIGVPRLELHESVGSTLDIAHELAAKGSPAGTLVLANEQLAGRGRGGRTWASEPGRGIWLTIVERPPDAGAVGVLSLRLGLEAASALDVFAPEHVQLKWPNDLYCDRRKLGGVLVEMRWRSERPEWVAIGLGINVAAPRSLPAAGELQPGTSRVEVLAALVPALRRAALVRGSLTPGELAEFASRDIAAGRRCTRPVPGVVRGITPAGELRVAITAGEATFRGGSLLLETGPEEAGERVST
ncbi:MAG: biotin--[acetyl-CoA-carboxylase] ligase [Gemmatimonadaceae bacterium]